MLALVSQGIMGGVVRAGWSRLRSATPSFDLLRGSSYKHEPPMWGKEETCRVAGTFFPPPLRGQEEVLLAGGMCRRGCRGQRRTPPGRNQPLLEAQVGFEFAAQEAQPTTVRSLH